MQVSDDVPFQTIRSGRSGLSSLSAGAELCGEAAGPVDGVPPCGTQGEAAGQLGQPAGRHRPAAGQQHQRRQLREGHQQLLVATCPSASHSWVAGLDIHWAQGLLSMFQLLLICLDHVYDLLLLQTSAQSNYWRQARTHQVTQPDIRYAGVQVRAAKQAVAAGSLSSKNVVRPGKRPLKRLPSDEADEEEEDDEPGGAEEDNHTNRADRRPDPRLPPSLLASPCAVQICCSQPTWCIAVRRDTNWACTGGIDEADIAVEGLEAAVAALERLTQMLAYNCRDEVTYGLRVRALWLSLQAQHRSEHPQLSSEPGPNPPTFERCKWQSLGTLGSVLE